MDNCFSLNPIYIFFEKRQFCAVRKPSVRASKFYKGYENRVKGSGE